MECMCQLFTMLMVEGTRWYTKNTPIHAKMIVICKEGIYNI